MMVEILIGNIASGKSTYCNNRAKEGAIVVSDDGIVNALHSNDYTLYDKKIKPLYKSIENHIITTAVAMGLDVVIDRGLNLIPESRRRFIGIASSLDVDCIAIVFPFEEPKIHADRRKGHNMRGHTYEYWLKVATVFNQKYKRPTEKEGFTKVVTL